MQAPKELVVLCLTMFGLAYAQEQLRTDLIESARTQKQEHLTPESEPKPERRIESIEHSVPYRLLTGDLDGFGVGLGTVIPGSAFAVLPSYTRTDLLAGRLTLRINALAATNESYSGGLDLAMPSVFNGYGFVDFNLGHRDISEMPYYGPGPDSRKTGRSDYRLEETTDDPNDIVPHQDRRELRGLAVFAAWLDHHDTRSINSVDSLVEENGAPYLKHYLLDFGSILGSNGTAPKHPWSGHEYTIHGKGSLVEMMTLGLDVPRWARAEYPNFTGVGRFDAWSFDPVTWKPNYPNPAFLLMDAEDAFWAAKQIAAFNEVDIRALVETGEYSDRRAEDWIVRCLIARRDKIMKTYFSKILPLDRFRVNRDQLEADDLAGQYGFACVRDYAVQWYTFDNSTGAMMPLEGETTLSLPRRARDESRGAYFAARIHNDDSTQAVIVYVRNNSGRMEVVGVDRSS